MHHATRATAQMWIESPLDRDSQAEATGRRRARGSTARSTPIRRSTSGSQPWRRCEPDPAPRRVARGARSSCVARPRRAAAAARRPTAEEAGRVHDHDHQGAAGRAAHRPARPGRRRAGPAGACRSRSTTTPAAPGRRPASTPPTSCGTRSSRARRTRFLAMFQSQVPDVVGPVRSVRLTDPLIVWPVGGVFAYSGGAKYAVDAINQAPVVRIDESAAGDAMFRDSAAPAAAQPVRAAVAALHQGRRRRCRRRRCSTTPPKPVTAGTPASAVHDRVREPGVRADLHLGRGDRAPGSARRARDRSS